MELPHSSEVSLGGVCDSSLPVDVMLPVAVCSPSLDAAPGEGEHVGSRVPVYRPRTLSPNFRCLPDPTLYSLLCG